MVELSKTVTLSRLDAFGGGTSKTAAENYAAFVVARAQQVKELEFGPGTYQFDKELILDWPVRFVAAGRGRSNRITTYAPLTTLLWTGDGAAYRTVKTRRGYRATTADPADETMSACINIQMTGVELTATFAVEIDSTATNWDNNVFVGCRTDVIVDCATKGVTLKANVYLDVTRMGGIGELVGWDGVTYPVTTEMGADGFHCNQPYIQGGRWGLVILGAQPKSGLVTYGYDYITQLGISFASPPLAGDTVTLGESVFTYTDDPSAVTDILTPTSTSEAAAGLLAAILNLLTITTSTSAPKFESAVYLANGSAAVLCVARDPSSSTFVNTFTAATNASGRITLTGATPTVGPDPALYLGVRDGRGGYGASDIFIGAGAIYGGNLVTKRRAVDIRPDHNQNLEGWSAGGVWIDGLAGNSSRAIQGIKFHQVRVDSIEPFRYRLDRCNCVTIDDGVVDRNGDMSALDTNGVALSVNYATVEDAYYGNVAKTVLTYRFLWIGQRQSFYTQYFNPFINITNIIGSRIRDYLGTVVAVGSHFRVGFDSAGNETATIRMNGGQNDGWVGVLFGTRTSDYLGSVRYYFSSKKLSIRTGGSGSTAGTETFAISQSSSISVLEGGLGAGVSLRATDNVTSGADAEVRSGTNGVVRVRNNSTTVNRFLIAAIFPGADGTQNLGSSGLRYNDLFLVNAPTVSSDRRIKQDIKPIDDAALDAWGDVEPREYRLSDSVEAKGKKARKHFGYIAQDIEEAFSKRKLDAFEYGLLCFDKWDDEYERDDDGNEVIIREAGDLYSVRYPQAEAIETAWQRRELKRLRAK